jgi:hypothetical protein
MPTAENYSAIEHSLRAATTRVGADETDSVMFIDVTVTEESNCSKLRSQDRT